MPETAQITIRRPDDWHLHLRDGAMLKAVLPATARHFARAIVMPNLKPPVTTTAAAAAYRDRILAALPQGMDFMPLMTAYLTDGSDPDDLERGFKDGVLTAAKLYPAGATTNSDSGVTDMQAIAGVLARLEKIGMPLLFHSEVADADIDFFDREAVFIDRVIVPMRRSFPALKMVLEHISTAYAASYVMAEAQNSPMAATITAHHMAVNRNAMFEGGLRAHHFCLPILKREDDRRAVWEAATSGAPMFFAGTDSAPHPRSAKETERANGGIFSAPHALSLYAELFDQAGALDRLEAFMSLNGPSFYGLPINATTLTLEKAPPAAESFLPFRTDDGDEVVPFPSASFPLAVSLSWRVKEA